ncbi:MAG: menaquinone biosynthetic enzyme MqnA/MqnD family protein [Planctomycetaceae bacterium]
MLRVGAVSYLNSRPLICGLRERLKGIGTLTLNLPSRLADDLRAGKLDVALVPSIEYLSGIDRGYRAVSNAVIACRGPVWSVRLLSRVPISRIRRLALDEGSRTSAALVQILLAEQFGLRPQTVPLEIEQVPEAVDADAVLLIGDRAMHPPTGVYEEIWDLGERWCDWTGLPFVFALWVARAGMPENPALTEALQASRDEGLARLDEIARREAAPHGLTVSDLTRYFGENLHFELGKREQDGLDRYRAKAREQGLLSDSNHPPRCGSVAAGHPADRLQQPHHN